MLDVHGGTWPSARRHARGVDERRTVTRSPTVSRRSAAGQFPGAEPPTLRPFWGKARNYCTVSGWMSTPRGRPTRPQTAADPDSPRKTHREASSPHRRSQRRTYPGEHQCSQARPAQRSCACATLTRVCTHSAVAHDPCTRSLAQPGRLSVTQAHAQPSRAPAPRWHRARALA